MLVHTLQVLLIDLPMATAKQKHNADAERRRKKTAPPMPNTAACIGMLNTLTFRNSLSTLKKHAQNASTYSYHTPKCTVPSFLFSLCKHTWHANKEFCESTIV